MKLSPNTKVLEGRAGSFPHLPPQRLSNKHLGTDFSWEWVLARAVRAKATVRSSVLCSLDELCKTFFFLKDNVKNIKKMSTKSGGLPFSPRVKLAGCGRKTWGSRTKTLQHKTETPFNTHHTLKLSIGTANVQGAGTREGHQLRRGRPLLSTLPYIRMSDMRAAAKARGIRTLPRNQSYFPG